MSCNHVIHTESCIKNISSRYIDEFLGLTCCPDLITNKIFPNSKEITESFAAYNTVRKYFWRIGFQPSDPSITLFAIGDGKTPRTGATFAYRTAWQCYSIDPLMNYNGGPIQRLSCISKKIEDVTFTCDKAVIVAVHSHASLDIAITNIIAKEYAVIAIPCCKKQEITGQCPIKTYKDYGIFSPERNILVWHFTKE
jgi:hypothetical protein